MKRNWSALAVMVPFVLVAGCTDAAKAPAEAAMAAAATAVDSLTGEAARYAPEAVKGVEGAYASAKDLVAKQDYKGALALAQDIPAKAKEAIAKASAAKQALLDGWNEASSSIPKMLDAAKSRLDILAQAKKLPAGMDKAALAKAQEGLASLQAGWSKVSEQFKAGDLANATAKAKELKAQGSELLKAIGLD